MFLLLIATNGENLMKIEGPSLTALGDFHQNDPKAISLAR